MNKLQVEKLMEGFLSNQLPERTTDLTIYDRFEVSPRLMNREKTVQAYYQISYGLKALLDRTPEGEPVRLKEYLKELKALDGRNVMSGPGKLSELADDILSLCPKEPPAPATAQEKENLKIIAGVLHEMRDELPSETMQRFMEAFAEMASAPLTLIKLEKNQLAAENLSASYADNSQQGNAEKKGIAFVKGIYDRIEKALGGPGKSWIDEVVSIAYSGTLSNKSQVYADLEQSTWFEGKLGEKILGDLNVVRSLRNMASMGKESFNQFPTEEVSRILLNGTSAGNDGGKQAEKLKALQEAYPKRLESVKGDPKMLREATVHGNKVFALIERHLNHTKDREAMLEPA